MICCPPIDGQRFRVAAARPTILLILHAPIVALTENTRAPAFSIRLSAVVGAARTGAEAVPHRPGRHMRSPEFIEGDVCAIRTEGVKVGEANLVFSYGATLGNW